MFQPAVMNTHLFENNIFLLANLVLVNFSKESRAVDKSCLIQQIVEDVWHHEKKSSGE